MASRAILRLDIYPYVGMILWTLLESSSRIVSFGLTRNVDRISYVDCPSDTMICVPMLLFRFYYGSLNDFPHFRNRNLRICFAGYLCTDHQVVRPSSTASGFHIRASARPPKGSCTIATPSLL